MLIGLPPPQSPTTLLIASQPTKRIVAETSSSPLFGAVSKCHQCCKCTLSKKHPFPPCLAFSWSQFSWKPQAWRLLGCLNLFFCKDNSDVDVSTIFGFPHLPQRVTADDDDSTLLVNWPNHNVTAVHDIKM